MSVVLGMTRGDRIEEIGMESEPVSSKTSPSVSRRIFLNSLAYLCDYKKFGDSVTAIALERAPEGIVYQVASNNNEHSIKKPTFIERILHLLSNNRKLRQARLEEEILMEVLDQNSGRILRYSSKLNESLKPLIDYLKKVGAIADNPFLLWLQDVHTNREIPRNLIELAYYQRSSQQPPMVISTEATNSKNTKLLANVEHIAKQLSRTIECVKILVQTSFKCSYLFTSYNISRIESSIDANSPLVVEGLTIREIVMRMLDDPSQISEYEDGIIESERKPGLTFLKDGWQPKVHAELLVLDFFHTRGLKFFDDDPYIACSKASCYCFYHYIEAYQGKYALPGCHNNAYIRWKVPDIADMSRPELIEFRDKFLIETTKMMQKGVLDQLAERTIKPIHRTDSE